MIGLYIKLLKKVIDLLGVSMVYFKSRLFERGVAFEFDSLLILINS